MRGRDTSASDGSDRENTPSGPYDRRKILRALGAGGIAMALAGCSSNGGGNGGDGDGGDDTTTTAPSDGSGVAVDHETPHPDDETLPDAEATGTSLSGGEREPGNQSPKDNASVMLQHEPSDGQNCGTCALYVPDQDGDGFGACTTVAGKIHPCDWCLLYSEYSGEGGVECQ
jgi:hypothetical protein